MIFTAFSLFAGAGGIDVGIRQAGFRTLCAIESDPHCVATLRRNDTRKVVWQADVGVIDPARAMAALGLTAGTLGLLTCGPPTRLVLGSGGEDPRIPAMFEVLRFATVLRPYAILIAQAPAFLPIRIATGRRLLEVLRERLDGLGYDMHADVVDACDLGVAQRRRCAVVVGVPKERPFELPRAELRTPAPTVGTALRGLPAPSRRGEPDSFPNHVDITPARARERIAHVPEGLWLAKARDAPAAVRGRLTARDTTKFRRLNRTAVAPTLHVGEALFHPTEDRYITTREAARLQGFPDKHVFEGPLLRRTGRVKNLDQYRQVASSVPPGLARSIARDLRRNLRTTILRSG